MDILTTLDMTCFSRDDTIRIQSAYESRKSHFVHTGDCTAYFHTDDKNNGLLV